MGDQKRGNDAADHAPTSDGAKPGGVEPSKTKSGSASAEQEAPNYNDRDAGGRAIPVEDVNSANDE